MSVKTKAHELARAIRESKEWQRVQKAREEIEKHEAAKIMLRDFNRKQIELYQKQMQGQEPSEQDIGELQRILETISFNPYVREFLEAEHELTTMIAEVQDILSEALGIKPPDEIQTQSAPASEKPKSKLWTPR